MTEKNVLDLYRHEFESSKEEHYFHYNLDGYTTLTVSYTHLTLPTSCVECRCRWGAWGE